MVLVGLSGLLFALAVDWLSSTLAVGVCCLLLRGGKTKKSMETGRYCPCLFRLTAAEREAFRISEEGLILSTKRKMDAKAPDSSFTILEKEFRLMFQEFATEDRLDPAVEEEKWKNGMKKKTWEAEFADQSRVYRSMDGAVSKEEKRARDLVERNNAKYRSKAHQLLRPVEPKAPPRRHGITTTLDTTVEQELLLRKRMRSCLTVQDTDGGQRILFNPTKRAFLHYSGGEAGRWLEGRGTCGAVEDDICGG